MPTQKEYIPWTPREEDSLEDWLHKHAHLKWAEKAQYYPKPRTVDGLRSKLRAIRQGERRHSRILRPDRHRRRNPPQRLRERPNERNRGRRVIYQRSVTIDRQSSVADQEDPGVRAHSPSMRVGSESPADPNLSPATLEGGLPEPGKSLPPKMNSASIEPFRPQQFDPSTRIAAMIRIGQSIIQLPLRLLACD